MRQQAETSACTRARACIISELPGGERIDIAGAGGGLGHFAVQMAKIHALKVIGSAGKSTTMDLLRPLGADPVVDYSKGDLAEEILILTDGRGVDVVYDSTDSPSSHRQSSAVTASGGEYIRRGTSAQLRRFASLDLSSEVEARGGMKIIGYLARFSTDLEFQTPKARASVIQGLKQAVRWTEERKLKAEITRTVPLDPLSLQRAFEAFSRGEIDMDELAVRCLE
jgi:NADPH2:quinone reductase